MAGDPGSGPLVAPYGSWESPFSTEMITEGGVGLGGLRWDGDDLWWSEARPAEDGRIGLVCRPGEADGSSGHGAAREVEDDTADVLHLGWSARTRVHEYGGAAWWLGGRVLFFVNWDDQRLYRFEPGGHPEPITPEPENPHALRYADGVVTPDGRHVVCVRERHSTDGAEPVNEIVVLAADGSGEVSVLVSGPDFVAAPRVDPSGTQLAWIQWDHPRMPWDGTELAMAALDGTDGIGPATIVAGGLEESVIQPQWAPDGALWFLSDRSDWWNLHRFDPTSGTTEAHASREAEIGGPAWVFGLTDYDIDGSGRVVFGWGSGGLAQLSLLDPSSGDVRTVSTGLAGVGSIRVAGDQVAFLGASTVESMAVRTMPMASLEEAPVENGGSPEIAPHRVVHRGRELTLDEAEFSVAEAIEFPAGPNGERTSHAYLYLPTNPRHVAPDGERPPLIVFGHGGPTSAASAAMSVGIQFWTSRGFAVADVDYGGSTGYGRAYRRLLDGAWGIVDVEDCVAVAQHLVDQGVVDGERLAISGGSAGGFTTLAALAFHDTFTAGASHYGVADLAALAEETHKFESRYLDGLVGPWPEAREVYQQRSPIHHTDGLSCPLILLQGLEDEIVPPSQAQLMVSALRAKGLPFAYVPFEGEQHGFRKAENITRALESELSFYAQVFGFEPADDMEPVVIENLG